MNKQPASEHKPTRRPIPDFIRKALQDNILMAVYLSRQTFQRNEYVAWIMRAKKSETREQRLSQMLDELARGGQRMTLKRRDRRPDA